MIQVKYQNSFSIGQRSRLFLATAGLAVGLLIGCGNEGTAPSSAVVDLAGKPVDPFQAADAKAIVFIFISIDCPISNRYAPEVRRLHEKFASRGVAFWLVYPDPETAAAAIEKHLREYQYPLGALRDPRHALVKRAKVRVTPEAAIFAPAGKLVYHGRIDDRYVDFGKERPEATRHDLGEALEATLAGRPVANAVTRAIGCYISDLR